jgi:hypothetical protein
MVWLMNDEENGRVVSEYVGGSGRRKRRRL